MLRAFLTALDSGEENLTDSYFAPASDFARWWDPTLPAGRIVRYSDLDAHLSKLRREGVALAVTSFTTAGYQGAGTPDAGGWFTFRFQGRPAAGAAERAGSGKGGIDCRTGRLKAMVLQW